MLRLASSQTKLISLTRNASRILDGRVVIQSHRRISLSRPTMTMMLSTTGSIAGAILGYHYKPTICENEIYSSSMDIIDESYAPLVNQSESSSGVKGFLIKVYKKLKKYFRIFFRIIELMVISAPLAALYPIARLGFSNDDDEDELYLQDWWLRLCLRSVEHAGAAVIKLMQWASSRPDLFGNSFCSVFAKLHDDTTPHSWEHTCQLMTNAYGENWEKRVKLDKLIGSGCIGQVYKGSIEDEDGKLQDIAVKVMHPNIRWAINSDLDLLRFAVTVIERFPLLFKGVQWFNLNGIIDEFAAMLKLQLDFRVEAENLDKFNQNFADEPRIVFPVVLREQFEPKADVLVESFCDGTKLTEFVAENKENEDLLKSICDFGIRSMIKMIFEHNLIHGDCHPGNILISKDNQLILLDAGIALEYTNDDHELVVNVLSSFIKNDGMSAAQYMLSNSNEKLFSLQEAALNEKEYVDKIDKMTRTANDSKFFMDDLGHYIGQIFDAAATHHVMMNKAFVSMALAVKVQEGVALMLSREANVMRTAIPIISHIEMQRKMGNFIHQSSSNLQDIKKIWRRKASTGL